MVRFYNLDIKGHTLSKNLIQSHILASCCGNFGPDVSLTLCCFVVYSTRRFDFCLALCYFVLVFFSPFNIAITSLGEEIVLVLYVRLFDMRLFFIFYFFIFLISAQNIDCGYSLEPPRRGGSNEYPQSMF